MVAVSIELSETDFDNLAGEVYRWRVPGWNTAPPGLRFEAFDDHPTIDGQWRYAYIVDQLSDAFLARAYLATHRAPCQIVADLDYDPVTGGPGMQFVILTDHATPLVRAQADNDALSPLWEPVPNGEGMTAAHPVDRDR